MEMLGMEMLLYLRVLTWWARTVPKKQNRRRCSSLISCGILRGTEVAEVWLLKLLAELNHRRWFSATDINTDLGGAGACQLAARLR